jgi:acetylornithine deacetylase/succinyl-diaminopimelate desuccinylase-like protein
MAWLRERLAGAGGTLAEDGAGNLIWRWGAGDPRVVVAAHVDTAFPAETPLDARREGDALVGPGVGDNAAAVALAVHVVEPLVGAGRLGPGAVAFTVGEEGLGNLRGAIAVAAAWPRAAFVALEGHGLEHVLVDAVGSVRARVEVEGPGGHSWVDRGGPSAIHALLDLGRGLTALGTPETPVNIGRLAGGTAVNAIAARAELTVEMRALDEAALEDFASALGRLSAPAPLRVAARVLGRRPAGRLPREDPLLAAARAARAEAGLPDALDAGSTDAAAALARGMSAICIGATTGSGMHTPGERIDIPGLALGWAQLEGLLLRLLAPA